MGRGPDLWERTAALATLDRLVADSAQHGRVALMAGEAGLGKSSVLRAFADRHRHDAQVLWGYCDRLLTPLALGPLRDIGRQVGGPLAARLQQGAPAEEVFAASLDVLSGPAQRRRPVVVVEDAHWADEVTLDWLGFLSRRIDRLAALLVITYRDDELPPGHPLRRVVATMPSGAAARIPLDPLSAACVAEQARRAGRSPELVHRLAGGNPLLVTELLKADERAQPAAVQDLILYRLGTLPAPARELAELVSVVPGRAELALVAELADHVDEGVAAGVLTRTPDGVAYRHELLRSVVEDALAPPRRRDLHARVLTGLGALPGVDPGRLVHHARAAGDAAAVLELGRRAGAGAARQGAHRVAADHYAVALEHAEQLPPADRAELLEAYAEQAHLTGRHEEALEARTRALALREALRQTEQVGENLRQISQLAWWTGRAALVREAADRAVSVLEALPPNTQLAMAYVGQAQVAYMDHRLADSRRWADGARVLAARLGDEDLVRHARITGDTARLAGGDLDAWTSLQEIARTAAADGRPDPAARALISLATVAADELALYARAEPAVERALTFTTAHGLDGFTAAILGARAALRLERGDWAGALVDADTVLGQVGERDLAAVLPLVTRGRIATARGEPEALGILDRAATVAEGIGDISMLAPVADARAEYFLVADDPARAREEARRGLQLAGGERGQPFPAGRLVYRLWRAGGDGPVPPAIAEPYRLMIAGAWSAAAEIWADRGGVYLRAEALAAGDEGAASTALRILDDLGATRVADRLRARLRRQGHLRLPRGPRRATVANPAGLTPRQLDVLALVAEGCSNAEIAGRLSLSPKTVDHHVSAVLAKLGVGSRGQAAALARRGPAALGLPPAAG